MYQFCKPITGYYEGHYLRSFAELMVALHIQYVRKKIFFVEAIKLTSKVDGSHKIPDFVVVEPDGIGYDIELLEVKTDAEDIIKTIIKYAEKRYQIPPGVQVKFLTAGYQFIARTKRNVAAIIGQDKLDQIIADYKAQSNNPTMGYIGERNGMFGRKHSAATKKLLSAKAAKNGAENGMFGRTHTPKAKLIIAQKWQDESYKLKMLRNGFVTHLSKMSPEQKTLARAYYADRINDIQHKLPPFINRCYTMSAAKIEKWFDSASAFEEILYNVS